MENYLFQHHQQNKTWKGQLDFYKQEIDIFSSELAHIMGVYADSYSVIEHIEEYEKIFSKKKELIDTLSAELITLEKYIVANPQGNADELWDHQKTAAKMNDFVSEMEALKKNFRRFTARHLHH